MTVMTDRPGITAPDDFSICCSVGEPCPVHLNAQHQEAT